MSRFQISSISLRFVSLADRSQTQRGSSAVIYSTSSFNVLCILRCLFCSLWLYQMDIKVTADFLSAQTSPLILFWLPSSSVSAHRTSKIYIKRHDVKKFIAILRHCQMTQVPQYLCCNQVSVLNLISFPARIQKNWMELEIVHMID